MNSYRTLILMTMLMLYTSCTNDDEYSETSSEDCTTDQVLDTTRGLCNQELNLISYYNESIDSGIRKIVTNNIPDHFVGLFGNAPGALSPNTIQATNPKDTLHITMDPEPALTPTPLLSTTGNVLGPQYSFGVLLNGVELDPVAAEPFPHQGLMSTNVNWEWNLEALNVNLGLDCNNAHVQPSGKYHYHGAPITYFSEVNSNQMTLIGYAADGYPIYYKYAYSDAYNMDSQVIEMTSSYKLKSGNRPGDGSTAPCGVYNGIYSNDYEYDYELGTLDEFNGRIGYTPDGVVTFYYVITDEFPSIPRYFKGTPSDDFKIGN